MISANSTRTEISYFILLYFNSDCWLFKNNKYIKHGVILEGQGYLLVIKRGYGQNTSL